MIPLYEAPLQMEKDQRKNQIEEGVTIVYVQNTQLAAVLVAVNVLLRKDPPYVYFKNKRTEGKPVARWCFNARSEDGLWKTVELIKFWKKDLDWILANPSHPFSIAMSAVKNFVQMTEHLSNQKPFVQFQHPTKPTTTIWLIEGSRKHALAVQMKFKQL